MGINEILKDLEDKGEELKEFYAEDINVGDVVYIPDSMGWSHYGIVLTRPYGYESEWVIWLADEHVLIGDSDMEIKSCHINIPEIEYIKDGLRRLDNDIYA